MSRLTLSLVQAYHGVLKRLANYKILVSKTVCWKMALVDFICIVTVILALFPPT